MKVRDVVSLLWAFCFFIVFLAAFYFQFPFEFPEEKALSVRTDQDTGNEAASFFRQETDSDFRLTYSWEDFNQNKHTVTFSLTKNSLEEAENEFGFFPDDLERYIEDTINPLRREMLIRLKTITEELIQKSRYADYFSIEQNGPESFNLKLSAPPSLKGPVKKEFSKITKEISKQQEQHSKKIEKEKAALEKKFLVSKGLRSFGNGLGVNYGAIVTSNQERLQPAFLELIRTYKNSSIQLFLSSLLSFIQDVHYGIPPVVENGKRILGFWVPPKVLINNLGDCDSKGVTFASLWINFKKYPILFIKIPNHLFVGLALPSFSDDGITIRGLKYTLCEVTGPGKLPAGLITPYSRMHLEGGSYSYELIN